MRSQAEIALAMRDNGKDWTTVAERTGMTIREAKYVVERLKVRRRHGLAHTPANESQRGLLDTCYHSACAHPRKEHRDGHCQICGPERTIWRIDSVGPEGASVTRFVEGAKPERPEGTSVMDWYASPDDRGCNEFVETPGPSGIAWLDRLHGLRGAPALNPMPKPTKGGGLVGAGWLRSGSGRRNASMRPAMPQVARKRKRNPGSRGKSRFVPPSERAQ